MRGAIVPSSGEAIATSKGLPTPVWIRFFNVLVQAPSGIVSVTPTASPFRYTASGYGNLAVSGGTVSSITLTRNNVTAATGLTSGMIPMANGDIAVVTYSGAPTISFIPG